MKVAEDARDVSRLKLEFTEVTAPFAGRVSGPVLVGGKCGGRRYDSSGHDHLHESGARGIQRRSEISVHLNRLRREGKIKGG